MEEDDIDASKKRGLNSGLITLPTDPESEGTLVLADKSFVVSSLLSNFEAVAPPSPNTVRDPKRKKTGEEEVSANNTKNGALAGSLEGRRQAQ
jgi:hypothetical protein